MIDATSVDHCKWYAPMSVPCQLWIPPLYCNALLEFLCNDTITLSLPSNECRLIMWWPRRAEVRTYVRVSESRLYFNFEMLSIRSHQQQQCYNTTLSSTTTTTTSISCYILLYATPFSDSSFWLAPLFGAASAGRQPASITLCAPFRIVQRVNHFFVGIVGSGYNHCSGRWLQISFQTFENDW